MKKNIYFNEYNLEMGQSIYLPLVSGLLASYAKLNKRVSDFYKFMPYNFVYQEIDKLVSSHKDPYIIAFSVSMWNINLSHEIAKRLKKLYPDCIIIFGGASSPFKAKKYLEERSFIDIVVHGEGEKTFSKILEQLIDNKNLNNISGITYRFKDQIIKNELKIELEKNLDNFPSPYLTGEFDYLLKEGKYKYQVILETNRGCPYNCSFCFWGLGGLDTRYRFFSVDYVKEIATWCGEKKIEYIFCADSNFGIHKRDIDIANYFVKTKQEYGYPEKFRVCYAKNSSEQIFKICKLFHEHKLDKGATLSFQTINEQVAKNVGRKNIKLSKYKELLNLYNKSNIPVYTELILGLPGESYQTFLDGIDTILSNGIKNQLFIYLCQVYINTDMDKKEYRKEHGIKTITIPLSEIHCSPKNNYNNLVEYEEIIVETNTLKLNEWKKAVKISWLIQLLHGLKMGYFLLKYLYEQLNINFSFFANYLIETAENTVYNESLLTKEINMFEERINAMLNGNTKCIVTPEYGEIYWDIEELAFINIINNGKELFYRELKEITRTFFKKNKIEFSSKEIDEVFIFQENMIPNIRENNEREINFNYNLKSYFQNDTPLIKEKESVTFKEKENYQDIKRYAKFVILYGRKSDKILREIT